MIRVHCYYRTTDKPWGGANSFLLALKRSWVRSGAVEFVEEFEGDYDILFLNSISGGPERTDPKRSSIHSREVRNLRRFGTPRSLPLWASPVRTPKKVVIRSVNLDRFASGGRFYTHRDREIIRIMNMAEHVVLQSAYMQPVFWRAGYCGKAFTVIHNGADSGLFHSRGRVQWSGQGRLRVLSASFSERAIKRFDLIAKISEDPRVECSHVGNWNSKSDPRNVRLLGVLPRDQLADLMRKSHAFAHPAVHDACPNVVQEALSCGLPVLYSEDGGARELAEDYGVCVDAGIPEALDQLMGNYAELTERILRDTHRFSIERAAEQYLAVLRSTHTAKEHRP